MQLVFIQYNLVKDQSLNQLFLGDEFVNYKLVKSPLNYIGGKFNLLNQIFPLFPKNIIKFVDLFSGGGNIGINIKAEEIYFNDNLTFLIDMFKIFREKDLQFILDHIDNRIEKFNLSITNKDGYNNFRKFYNEQRNPIDLFVLIAFSFNHQIRFNNSHEFNNPFGNKRSSYNKNMKQNLIEFITELKRKNFIFSNLSFEDFNFSILTEDDFIYCDPPYLITTGTYNDGKRGFTGWSKEKELELLKILDSLNSKKIRFALSNVLQHKGKENLILSNWIKSNPNYKIHYLNKNYSNSNYQTKDRNKNSTIEVLITNY